MSIFKVLQETEDQLESYKKSLEVMKGELSYLPQMHERLVSFQEGLSIKVPSSEPAHITLTLKLGQGQRQPTVYRQAGHSEDQHAMTLEDLTAYESYRPAMIAVFAAIPAVCEAFRDICAAKASGLDELRAMVAKSVTNLNLGR